MTIVKVLSQMFPSIKLFLYVGGHNKIYLFSALKINLSVLSKTSVNCHDRVFFWLIELFTSMKAYALIMTIFWL